MWRSLCAGAVTIWLIAALDAVAQEAPADPRSPPPDPALNEEVVKVPIALRLASGRMHHGQFVLTTFKPQGPGPFPAVIVNHGRDVAQKRATQGRNRMLAGFWLRRGFAVLAPTRLGYGPSGASIDPEAAVGPCDAKNYAQMAGAITAHIRTTIEYGRTLPWIDKDSLLLVGASVGGFGALAAAGARLPGVKGVVNFAGGTGGWVDKRPQQPCSPKAVAAQIVAAARQAPIPSIWIYAQNDRYWGPNVPRDWHAAYVAAGGQAEFHMLPPLGEDGHNIIGPGFAQWRPLIDRFLVSLGYAPFTRPPDAPSPTGFAPLETTPTVSRITPRCRELYGDFLKKDLPRAFALGGGGGCAYFAGQQDAVAKALARCQETTRQACKLYTVDDDVVWQEGSKPPVP